MPEPDYLRAHQFSIYHRAQIEASESCGCFYCLNIFTPLEITDWTDEQQGIKTTALCPYCMIDSVIGSASGFSITKEFLQKMRSHWFEEA